MTAFKIDIDETGVTEWHATETGLDRRHRPDYTPTVYIGTRDDTSDLAALEARLTDDPKVVATTRERWYTDLRRRERESVLRIDLDRPSDPRTLAREIRTIHERDHDRPPGNYRLYNVDLAPQFRYCLETETDPTPDRPLTTLSLAIPERAIAEGDVTALTVEGDTLGTDSDTVLRTLGRRVRRIDPDVLVVSTGDIIPLLADRADACGIDSFRLGRAPGWRQLAGASTFESYGRVGHSPARYDVPGRVLIDRSNSFLWDTGGLVGLMDLAERSGRPLQETAWGSIGTILTAIQIDAAIDRDVLIPWTKTDPEAFKSVDTLHTADRGGHTFEPMVGYHEDVFELDFASLYPNIMIEHNISPETVRCDCHARRADVPELGYSICDQPGFIPAILEPIVRDRERIKAELRTLDDGGETATTASPADLRAKSETLKWILVTCFGYQGYRNAKFGRIEAHEAINAFARELLLTAKTTFEANGWRILHGIVDSIWVQSMPDERQTPLEALADRITDAVDITLEFEAAYDWLCFLPRRDDRAGALTKYFGKRRNAGDDPVTVRGLACRQRSTSPFVAEAQRSLIETFDRHRDPEAVCDRLVRQLARLRSGDVDPNRLVCTQRVTQRREAYQQATRNVAALDRYDAHGLDRRPGQDVEYIVVDDAADGSERVRLPFESVGEYDVAFYADRLLRAATEVLAPHGWQRSDLRARLRETEPVGLPAFE
ncbi:MAG: type B DNA-directed DNA polymerase [Halobacteriales archaeon]|nr:type B DNA-directed DNA polymerase [Halobacteriales archaeon]